MNAKLPATANAPERVAYSLYQMLETGLVFYINRDLLHPQGLALAIDCGPDNEAGGWSIHASPDGEPIEFDLPDGFAEQREAAWKAIIEFARATGAAPDGAHPHWPPSPPDSATSGADA